MQRFTAILAIAAAGAVVASGCGISEEIYNRDVNALKQKLSEAESRYSTLQGRTTTLESELDTCKGKRDECQRELAAMKARGEKLDAGLQQALDRIAELEKVAARQRNLFNSLRGSLEALEQAGKLTIAIVRGQFTVQLSDAILFPLGSSRLRSDGKDTVREVAEILARIPGRRWQIAGHTDDTGTSSTNWALSSSRAWEVARHMIASGMPPERLSYAAYGQYQPTVPNDTKENRAQNRRIEIVLIPDLEEMLGPLIKGEGAM